MESGSPNDREAKAKRTRNSVIVITGKSIMPNPPALATPPATAPTSPTSPTSIFIAPFGESCPNVDLEKADGLVQEPDTIQKGIVRPLVQSRNYAPFTRDWH